MSEFRPGRLREQSTRPPCAERSPTPPISHEPDEQRLSLLLHRLEQWLARNPEERVSVGEVFCRLRRCGLGVGLLLFAVPSCIPMPPGFSTFNGAGLVIIAWQLMVGRSNLWLPTILARQRVSTALIGKIVCVLAGWVKRVGHLFSPRWHCFTGRLSRLVMGAVGLLLAIILMLPIPLMNSPPAIALTLMGLGLVESDGLLTALGLLLGVVVVGFVMAVSIAILILGSQWLSDLI